MAYGVQPMESNFSDYGLRFKTAKKQLQRNFQSQPEVHGLFVLLHSLLPACFRAGFSFASAKVGQRNYNHYRGLAFTHLGEYHGIYRRRNAEPVDVEAVTLAIKWQMTYPNRNNIGI